MAALTGEQLSVFAFVFRAKNLLATTRVKVRKIRITRLCLRFKLAYIHFHSRVKIAGITQSSREN